MSEEQEAMEAKVEKVQEAVGPAEGAAPQAPPPPNAYDLAEEGWGELIAAAAKIQNAAQMLKKSPKPIDGFTIEKALLRHRPDKMAEHLDGLRLHRKEKGV